jgi:hypothetical protein
MITLSDSDPYVEATVDARMLPTRVVDNNLNPTWNQVSVVAGVDKRGRCVMFRSSFAVAGVDKRGRCVMFRSFSAMWL